MLSLLLLALADGAAIVHPAPVVDPAMARPAPIVDQAMVRCDNFVIEAENPSRAFPALGLDRSLDDGQARRYLLLDRRDANNCPLPISHPIPNQPQALGRNLAGPAAAPASRPRSPEH